MSGASSIHGTTFAFYIESTQGEGPGYVAVTTPEGTASAWASAEGTNCFRQLVHEASPAWMRASDIENPQLNTSILASNAPIKGVGSADGGSVSMTWHGSESVTADTNAVTETSLMELMGHMLGGKVLGTSATVGVVTSDTDYAVSSATGLQAGQLIAIDDAGNTGKLFPQRIQTISGTDITTERDLSDFVITNGDTIAAVASFYPDGPALSDCSDANYSTITALIDKNGTVFEATGCVAQLDSIEFPRNSVPKLNISLMAGGVFPPGPNGIGVPVWTGTVRGAAGNAVGIRTRLHIQAHGTTTDTCYDSNGVTFTPGLPRVRVPTVTQCTSTLQATAAYTLGMGKTVLAATTLLNSTTATLFQTAFENTTAFTVTYYYTGSAGNSWCVHIPKAYIKSPLYTEADETKWYGLEFEAQEDSTITNASTPDLAKARFLLGMY